MSTTTTDAITTMETAAAAGAEVEQDIRNLAEQLFAKLDELSDLEREWRAGHREVKGTSEYHQALNAGRPLTPCPRVPEIHIGTRTIN